MTTAGAGRWGLVALAAVLLAGCGGRGGAGGENPLGLLAEGRCLEARLAAEAGGGADALTRRGVQALCTVVENPTADRAKTAANILRSGGGEVHRAAAATEMLTLAERLPEPLSPEASLRLAEAALGAVGFGDAAPADSAPTNAIGAATRTLTVAVLERIAAMTQKALPAAPVMLSLWNGCYSLVGGSFEAEDARQAWRWYLASARIALALAGSVPTSDLSQAVFGGAVSIVEANPSIQTAVRCDFASPFDDLKRAVAYNLPLMGRLEAAVKDAAGCTRGTYAPN